jgi:CRP-like cAMP-binding protein
LRIDWGTGSPLGRKLSSLGGHADDLDILLQAVVRCVVVATHNNVIREDDSAAQASLLLAGTTCSYKRKEDGARSILSFQHPGDFCDLHRYVRSEQGSAIGIQALTDCTIAIIDYQEMDRLLSYPSLASVLWRASMLEVAIYRQRLTSRSHGTALERVAHLLCEQLARRDAVGIYDPQLPISQIDIADATGLPPVDVNRTIQIQRSLNVLSAMTHAIEVVDRNQLAGIAKFDDRYLDISKLASKWAVQIERTRN